MRTITSFHILGVMTKMVLCVVKFFFTKIFALIFFNYWDKSVKILKYSLRYVIAHYKSFILSCLFYFDFSSMNTPLKFVYLLGKWMAPSALQNYLSLFIIFSSGRCLISIYICTVAFSWLVFEWNNFNF